jgi:hypothetical protein
LRNAADPVDPGLAAGPGRRFPATRPEGESLRTQPRRTRSLGTTLRGDTLRNRPLGHNPFGKCLVGHLGSRPSRADPCGGPEAPTLAGRLLDARLAADDHGLNLFQSASPKNRTLRAMLQETIRAEVPCEPAAIASDELAGRPKRNNQLRKRKREGVFQQPIPEGTD